MGYLAKRKSEKRERIALYVLLMTIPLLTLLGAIGGTTNEQFDFIGEFKIQAAVLSAFLCCFCLYKGLTAVSGCFFLFALMNLCLTASHYHFSEQKSLFPPEAPQFSFLYQDLKGADKKSDALKDLISQHDADLVLLTNVPVAVYEHLPEIASGYVLQNQTTDDTGKMMLMLARSPGSARGAVNDTDALWVSRIVGERKLTVVLSVLDNPWEGDYVPCVEKMKRIADFVGTRNEPVLLIGSFKASDWSRLTADLKDTAKLLLKEPLRFSYPANVLSFMRRPAASIYAHPGIDVQDIHILDDLDLNTQGRSAVVKMAPLKKEVRFYELQPTVDEKILLKQNSGK